MPSGQSGIPKWYESKVILNDGTTISSAYVTCTFSGTIRFFLAADGSTESWEEVLNISSDTLSTHSFTTTGDSIRWKAVLSYGASITKIIIQKAS